MDDPEGHRVQQLGPPEDAPIAEMALTVRLQALDPDAWEALYVHNRRLVRGVLAGIIGYGPELDDLTQQVFATAATLVRGGRVALHGDATGVRAWLAAIADRLGRGELRRIRAARQTLTADEPVGSPEGGADPVARQTLRHARAAWERLPDRLQTPWLLRHLERMTIDEIAATTAMSAATVKRRLAEADERFAALADGDPVLRDYFRRGGRP
jgi:RNA polymerase sigma factor (sigma-70 family)